MTTPSSPDGRVDYGPEPVDQTLSFPRATQYPAGYKVVAFGNFEPGATNSGWDAPHPMAWDAASHSYRVVVHNLTPGQSYEYQIRVTEPPSPAHPAGVVTHFPAAGANDVLNIPGPHHTTAGGAHIDTKEIYQQMGAAKKAIFDALKEHDTAEGVDGLIENLQNVKDSLGIRDLQTPLLLEIAAQVIRNDRSFPMAVRRQFARGATFADFNAFRTAMQRGSDIYRRSVFAYLKTDKHSRHAFHITPTAQYHAGHVFHDQKKNRLFDRLCSARDRGHAAEYFAVAMNSVDNPPAAKPALITARHNLLRNVLSRISSSRVSRLRSQHGNPKKKSFLAELAVQGAIGGVMYTAGFAPALLAWLGKGVAEVGTGVGIRDLIDAGSGENIASLIKDNNIFTQWWRTERSLGSILSHSIGGFLKRSIPIYGPWKHGPESAISEEAEGFEESEEEHEVGQSAEEYIEEACEKAMK